MTPADLDAIEERARAATPGPWVSEGTLVLGSGGVDWVCRTASGHGASPAAVEEDEANATLIAAARSDVPALCAALREAWEARDAARALCAPRPGMAAIEADTKDSLRVAWERLDEARQHGDSARARAGRAEALNVELAGALDSLLGLGLDCFGSGDTAPRDGCNCNTCETVREARAALEKAGTKNCGFDEARK